MLLVDADVLEDASESDGSDIDGTFLANGKTLEANNSVLGWCCTSIHQVQKYVYDSTTYHLVCFCSHYFSFTVALLSSIFASFGITIFATYSNSISMFGLIALIADMYLLAYNYRRKTYFPYCASVHLLYLLKGQRVEPGAPNSGVLWLWEKIGIFFQGYIFVVVPSQNVALGLRLYKDPHYEQYESLLHFLLLVSMLQLIFSFLAWIFFLCFYIVFLCEVLLRTLFFPCVYYRPRYNSSAVESDSYVPSMSLCFVFAIFANIIYHVSRRIFVSFPSILFCLCMYLQVFPR